MSTTDPLLQLQAHVDGELPESEQAAVDELLARDPRAAALAAELRAVGDSLRSVDPMRRVPETREFYWSQIRRRLDAPAVPVPQAAPSWGRLWGWLLPACGVAVAAVLLSLPRADRDPVEIQAGTARMLAGAPAVTFHSDTDGVTIHWVQ